MPTAREQDDNDRAPVATEAAVLVFEVNVAAGLDQALVPAPGAETEAAEANQPSWLREGLASAPSVDMSDRRTARNRRRDATAPSWWAPTWTAGSDQDPDAGWDLSAPQPEEAGWPHSDGACHLGDEAILAPLEAQFGQVRSRERVRDLAEVFTHQREVDAMLDQIPDAFGALDIKFLEPACGSGNFLVEILRRKLRLVAKSECATQEQYEHRLLRAAASIYGVDISPENVTEARARLAHALLEHYQSDANTIRPTAGFLNAAALILGDNVVVGDTLNAADQIELCDWQPRPGGFFQRVWSYALVPPHERDLLWSERIQDDKPVHFADLLPPVPASAKSRKSRVQR